jgi:hypothetical protein
MKMAEEYDYSVPFEKRPKFQGEDCVVTFDKSFDGITKVVSVKNKNTLCTANNPVFTKVEEEVDAMTAIKALVEQGKSIKVLFKSFYTGDDEESIVTAGEKNERGYYRHTGYLTPYKIATGKFYILEEE